MTPAELASDGEDQELENQPVHSEIPTLVMMGEMDPITPPEWGKLTLEGLPNAEFLELKAITGAKPSQK